MDQSPRWSCLPGIMTCSTVLKGIFKMFMIDSTIIKDGSEDVTSLRKKKFNGSDRLTDLKE